MTSPDYVSFVSLFPTIEFLELVSEKQWGTDNSYGLGLSTIVPLFHSTTSSEWLCLNSGVNFLQSPLGTVSVKNPFSYTRPESSPVLVSFNDLSVPSNKIAKAKSLFLFRIGVNGNEVITVSNYDKKPENTTTAPPIDCFSRECLSWFSSDVDWFIGFGTSSNSIPELIVNNNGIILDKSEDILSNLIESSTKAIAYSSVSFSSVTTLTPFVIISFTTGVQYIKSESTPTYNSIFLFNSDSLVALAGNLESSDESVYYDKIFTEVSFDSQEIIII